MKARQSLGESGAERIMEAIDRSHPMNSGARQAHRRADFHKSLWSLWW